MSKPLLEVKNLTKFFTVKNATLGGEKQLLKAVDNVSFTIERGKTLGLVGESGCGKTTVGRTIIRLYEPTAGEALLDGQNIYKLKGAGLQEARKKMQMIFQDPYASLNPRMTVGDIIAEPLDIHGLFKGKAGTARVHDLLRQVGLLPEHAGRFPHEFSGGQRQRIGIARALAVEPKFIICDEPISALDVSIQAQVVNMLEDLQEQMGLTYLFIAHDLAMVRHISDKIAVMYLGRLVELADADELYKNPLHPYTKALLSAVPIPDPRIEIKKQRIILEGEVPSPVNPPEGCRFKTRCSYVKSECHQKQPELKDVGAGHEVSCYLY
jgi:oligopeptide transport system ATP-binding protein